MSASSENTESLLTRAREQEKRYDWTGAAEIYQRTREVASEQDLLGIGNLVELKAHALYKLALQAK